jgi:hypothetical protein
MGLVMDFGRSIAYRYSSASKGETRFFGREEDGL